MHPSDNAGPAVEMPKYRSHKQVWALKIARLDGAQLSFVEKGYAPITVDPKMFVRYTPVPGDYYVVYDDGYKSISPAKAFEEGYTPISVTRPTIDELEKMLQEPDRNVTINPDGSVSG